MRKTIAVLMAVVFMLFLAVSGSSANTYYDYFPSNDSTVIASVPGVIPPFYYGYFFSATDGHMIEETFTGTGLESITGLKLSLNRYELSLTAPITWNVFVNNTFVGTWVYNPANDGAGFKDYNFIFNDIIGNGTYTIAMKVAQDLPVSAGSLYLGFDTPIPGLPGYLLLAGSPPCPCQTPIPGAVWLLGSGLVGLLTVRRKL